MGIAELMGLPLKSEKVVTFLNDLDPDLPVTYEFDRLLEGEPDSYSALSPSNGIDLTFDENQRLVTVHVYAKAFDGHEVADLEQLGLTSHDSFDAAEAAFKAEGRAYVAASAPGMHKAWIKVEHGAYSVHYQFEHDRLSLPGPGPYLITLQAADV